MGAGSDKIMSLDNFTSAFFVQGSFEYLFLKSSMVAYLNGSGFLEISNKDSDFKCLIFAVDCVTVIEIRK